MEHYTKSDAPSNGDYNFQIISHIINFTILVGIEFNYIHFETLFVLIDSKITTLPTM